MAPDTKLPQQNVAADPIALAKSIDEHVALRLKQRRIELGMSLEDVAHKLGTTWQQVMKYEAAENRISCGRLYEIGQVLGVPVLWFFLGASDDPMASKVGTSTASVTDDAVEKQLAEVLMNIRTPTLKAQLLQLARSMAAIDRSQTD